MLIVDGHNLIPNINGLSLRDLDDEESLAALLQEYARIKRRKVVIFFDGAPPGHAGERWYGTVRAFFVPARRTADDAIRQFLVVMGKAARTTTVVSSDRQVQANARELRAKVLPSEDFARELAGTRSRLDAPAAAKPEKKQASSGKASAAKQNQAGAQDVSEWIELFGLDPDHASQPIDLSKKPVKKPRPAPQKPAQSPSNTDDTKKPRRYHGFPKKS